MQVWKVQGFHLQVLQDTTQAASFFLNKKVDNMISVKTKLYFPPQNQTNFLLQVYIQYTLKSNTLLCSVENKLLNYWQLLLFRYGSK